MTRVIWDTTVIDVKYAVTKLTGNKIRYHVVGEQIHAEISTSNLRQFY